jgi:hypothetical protein
VQPDSFQVVGEIHIDFSLAEMNLLVWNVSLFPSSESTEIILPALVAWLNIVEWLNLLASLEPLSEHLNCPEPHLPRARLPSAAAVAKCIRPENPGSGSRHPMPKKRRQDALQTLVPRQGRCKKVCLDPALVPDIPVPSSFLSSA